MERVTLSERIVEVEWEDTLTRHGWSGPDELPTKCWQIRSVGYVIQDDDVGVVLVEARGESGNFKMADHGCATMIPRSAIHKVIELGRSTMDMTSEATIDETVGLREALDRIKSELGVPGHGYPANVANAWYIADAALKGHRFSFGDEVHAGK